MCMFASVIRSHMHTHTHSRNTYVLRGITAVGNRRRSHRHIQHQHTNHHSLTLNTRLSHFITTIVLVRVHIYYIVYRGAMCVCVCVFFSCSHIQCSVRSFVRSLVRSYVQSDNERSLGSFAAAGTSVRLSLVLYIFFLHALASRNHVCVYLYVFVCTTLGLFASTCV